MIAFAKVLGPVIVRRWKSVLTAITIFMVLAFVSTLRVNLRDEYEGRASFLFVIDDYSAVFRSNLGSLLNENGFHSAWLGDKAFLSKVYDRVVKRTGVKDLNFTFESNYDRIIVTITGDDPKEVQNALDIFPEEFRFVIGEIFSPDQTDLDLLQRQYQEQEKRLEEAQNNLEQFIMHGEIERIKTEIELLKNLLSNSIKIENSSVSDYADKIIKYEQLIRETKLLRERIYDNDESIASLLSLIAIQSREFGSVPLNFQFNEPFNSNVSADYVDTVLRSLQNEHQSLKEQLAINIEESASDRLGLNIGAIQEQIRSKQVILDRLENQYALLVGERDRLRKILFDLRDNIVNLENSRNNPSRSNPLLIKPIGGYVEKVPVVTFSSGLGGLILKLTFGVASGFIVGSLIVLYQDKKIRESLLSFAKE